MHQTIGLHDLGSEPIVKQQVRFAIDTFVCYRQNSRVYPNPPLSGFPPFMHFLLSRDLFQNMSIELLPRELTTA